MKKHPSEFVVKVWFSGGPNDEGLAAKAFKDLIVPTWPDVAFIEIAHHDCSVGKPLCVDLNWKVEFALDNASGTLTADALDALLAGMIAEQKPTQVVQVEITSKWQYGA